MSKKNKWQLIFILLVCIVVQLTAQTLKSLPQVIIKSFTEISPLAKSENLGQTLKTIFQTAFDTSLVFRVPDTVTLSDYSLTGLKKAFNPQAPRTVFLLDAYCLKYVNEIQVDLRIYDVFTGRLQDTFFCKVNHFAEVRTAVTSLVVDIKNALFRDTLSTLRLTTAPKICDIYLDGKYMGQTGKENGLLELSNLIPGMYTLRILAPGYMDYDDSLVIRPRHITNFNANLSLEPGILVIDSIPQGAEIIQDGKSSGVTPKRFDSIEPGEYNFILKLENYKSWENRIVIESRQEKNLSATLEILPGTLNLESNPQGVDVYYNRNLLGRTPFIKYNLEPGKYILEFSKEDYINQILSVVINPGKETKNLIELEKQTGQVTFLSTPEGADISVKGANKEIIRIGKTPVDKYALEVGYYDVVYEKEGYSVKTVQIQCNQNEIRVLNETLSHIPGSIRIASNPAQVNIYIDNAYRGISPVEIQELLPGTYKIEAKTAYGMAAETVTVEAGKVTELTLNVKKPNLGYLSGIMLTLISIAAYLSVSGL